MLRLGDTVEVKVGADRRAPGEGRPPAGRRRGTGSEPATRHRISPSWPSAKKRKTASPGDIASNRQASYRYNLLERFECGMVLEGTEVKAMRDGGAQLKDSYAALRDGEALALSALYIPPYGPAAHGRTMSPERPRKLLLHRRELDRDREGPAPTSAA